MVPGLDQFPAFHTFLTKETLQPSGAALKDIMDKTLAILIAFDGTLLFVVLWFWQFVNRNLVFPLDHRFSPAFKFQMPKFKYQIKSKIQVAKLNS